MWVVDVEMRSETISRITCNTDIQHCVIVGTHLTIRMFCLGGQSVFPSWDWWEEGCNVFANQYKAMSQVYMLSQCDLAVLS